MIIKSLFRQDIRSKNPPSLPSSKMPYFKTWSLLPALKSENLEGGDDEQCHEHANLCGQQATSAIFNE
jgi:hypothetical protein